MREPSLPRSQEGPLFHRISACCFTVSALENFLPKPTSLLCLLIGGAIYPIHAICVARSPSFRAYLHLGCRSRVESSDVLHRRLERILEEWGQVSWTSACLPACLRRPIFLRPHLTGRIFFLSVYVYDNNEMFERAHLRGSRTCHVSWHLRLNRSVIE